MRPVYRVLSAAILTLSLAFAGLSTSATAQEQPDPATVEELVKAVEGTYSNVTTFRADFTLVTRSAAMGESRQKGKVSLKRPRMMRWDSTGQGGMLFVTNGQKMWMYNPTDKQVIVYNDLASSSGSSGGMFDLLSGLGQLDEHFDVNIQSGANDPGKKSFDVLLKPKKAGEYKEIRLRVAKRRYDVEQIVLVDNFGGQTEISFSQVRLNQSIPDSEFAFAAPAGVAVINADGP